ncbi:MAG: nuclear transport factor 2 family protein [Pseudomonadota bacterium]
MTESERDLIERACEKLCIAYARHVDFSEAEAFADTFIEEGELEVFGQKLNSRQARLKFMANRPANRKALHLVTNIHVSVLDENHAEGISYITLFRADHDGPGPVPDTLPMLAGYMEDKYVRTPAGWKFSARKASMLFMKS